MREVFIIGGGAVYKQGLALCRRVYLTCVSHRSEDATVFFPALHKADWTVVSEESHPADEKHAYPYRFITLDRKE